MLDRIKALEKVARELEPTAGERAHLVAQVDAYAERYLRSLPTAPAHFSVADNGRGLYAAPLTEEGVGIEALLDLIGKEVDTPGINCASGRHLGYIPGGGLFPSALGDYLAAVTNRYAGVFYASPGAVRMENMLLQWAAGVVGYPAGSAGNLTSGGSIANLTGIVTARDAHGIEAETVRRTVVYMTAHVHHALHKALRIAGLEGCVRRIVPVDGRYRMQAGALERMITADRDAGLRPWLVVASAGTTNTGSIDPLSDVGHVADAHGLWYHVDGAYGAFFALCAEGRRKLRGMELSDSLVMDPHKTLFLPFGSGLVLVKDRHKLVASHYYTADYLQDAPEAVEEISPADVSPELTKHPKGLRMWLPLKLFGVRPFRAALEEKLLLARHFHARMQALDGFEVGPEPDLSVVTYRYVPPRGDANAFNRRLVHEIVKDGRIFISSTQLDGRFVLRLAIVSFRAHLDEIEQALEVIASKARQLAEGA